jgi:hypothetical protein
VQKSVGKSIPFPPQSQDHHQAKKVKMRVNDGAHSL